MASVQGFDPAHSGQQPVDDNGNPARFGVWGDSDTGVGVIGTSGVPTGDPAAPVFNAGVEGHSIDAPGVFGHSFTNVGVLAQSQDSSGVLGVTFTPGVPGQEPDGHGVFGVSTVGGNGVVGFVGGATGVVGSSVRGNGVRGVTGRETAVLGESFGDPARGESATGVVGTCDAGFGVRGASKSRDGVVGTSEAGDGVVGSSDNGAGVRGVSSSRDGVAGLTIGAGSGVSGLHFSTESGSGARGDSVLGSGVEGLSFSRDPNVAGVVGSNPQGFAGLFFGDVRIDGSLSKAGGGFEIDHPLDPEAKYLRHSFVESPDMLNVYNGNVTTDADGVAEVALPDYFEALNSDYRYQLTVVGKFAQAIVAEEITDNVFTIKTDQPEVKVSWQVTGIRQDRWAVANRISVEAAKESTKRESPVQRLTELLQEQLRPRVRQQLDELLRGKPLAREEMQRLMVEARKLAERRPEREPGSIDRAQFEQEWRQVEEMVQRMRPAGS
jgi:hypothetical protein